METTPFTINSNAFHCDKVHFVVNPFIISKVNAESGFAQKHMMNQKLFIMCALTKTFLP